MCGAVLGIGQSSAGRGGSGGSNQQSPPPHAGASRIQRSEDPISNELHTLRGMVEQLERLNQQALLLPIKDRIAELQEKQRSAKPFWQSIQAAAGQLENVRRRIDDEHKKLQSLEEQRAKLDQQISHGRDLVLGLELQARELQAMCEEKPHAVSGDIDQLLVGLPRVLGFEPDSLEPDVAKLLETVGGLLREMASKRPTPRAVPPPLPKDEGKNEQHERSFEVDADEDMDEDGGESQQSIAGHLQEVLKRHLGNELSAETLAAATAAAAADLKGISSKRRKKQSV